MSIRRSKKMFNKEAPPFEKEVNKIVKLGIRKPTAQCYVVNYYDEYICDKINGGCCSKETCESIHNRLEDLKL